MKLFRKFFICISSVLLSAIFLEVQATPSFPMFVKFTISNNDNPDLIIHGSSTIQGAQICKSSKDEQCGFKHPEAIDKMKSWLDAQKGECFDYGNYGLIDHFIYFTYQTGTTPSGCDCTLSLTKNADEITNSCVPFGSAPAGACPAKLSTQGGDPFDRDHPLVYTYNLGPLVTKK